ncbi:MAG: rhomboid family intramembrane serine protease [Sphingomonadaceae bacterium]
MRVGQSWAAARVTLAIAIVTAAAWLLVDLAGALGQLAVWAGFIPARADPYVDDGGLLPFILTPLGATLLHANIVHLGFNMLLLVYCGRAVENLLGPLALALLYVVGAYVAALGHYLTQPESGMPVIGASGAVSAVIGAYAMLFGENKVRVEHPGLALALHAMWLAAAWVALQLLVGIAFNTTGARIAIWAHIGGFFVGVALARPLLRMRAFGVR